MNCQLPPLPVVLGAQVRYLTRFPGYAVTDDGRVFSCRNKYRGGYCNRWREMGQAARPHGHRYVNFVYDRKQTGIGVHQLVLEAFVCRRPDGMMCCHNNGNASDNRLSNLRWGTAQDNTNDSIRHRTMHRGVSDEVAAAIAHEWSTTAVTAAALARKHGCSPRIVHAITNNRSKVYAVVAKADKSARPHRFRMSGIDLKGWGLWFRQQRLRANLTLQDIGDRCGLTRQRIALWERKTKEPRSPRLKVVYEALGVADQSWC